MSFRLENDQAVLLSNHQNFHCVGFLLRFFLVCYFLLFFVSTAHAQINYTISVYEDTKNDAEFESTFQSEEAISQKIFFKLIEGRENYGVTHSAFWFKIDVPAQTSTDAILEVGYPLLDEVDIHTQIQNSHQNWLQLEVYKPDQKLVETELKKSIQIQ